MARFRITTCIYWTLITIFLIVGCDRNAVSAMDPEIFELSVGESHYISFLDQTVTLDEVAADSRCPSASNVNCFWEGNAELVLTFSGQRSDNLTLVVNSSERVNTESDSTTWQVLGWRAQVVQLTPGTQIDVPINQSDYISRLRILPMDE